MEVFMGWQRRSSLHSIRFVSILFTVCSFAMSNGAAFGQTWETAVAHPGDDTYYLPPYPVVFVAAHITEVPSESGLDGNYHIGTDVLSANNPDRDNHVWVLLPTGQVEKLFPLNVHGQTPGLIDTPVGQLDKGSVVEPNVSEDGTKIYFSYFHDTTFESSFSFGLNRLPLKGADLYSIDMAPLIADPGVDPATLTVQRLTTRTYGSNGTQTNADKYKQAMNQTLAASTAPNDWGTVYMHAIEMRTATGLKLLYASDERRVQNSNQSMSIGQANHNFNLHLADLAADGSLRNPRQFQYYTTTSALSPTPLRNGVAFSYQASTEAARNWHMQGIDSAGRWYPILGYGTNPELFHLGAFCVKTTGASPGDYLVATRYYNANNEGFGALWAQDLSLTGLNTYDKSTYWGILPRQVGSYLLTQGVNSNDYPANKSGGQYIGKMTTPRCGRVDELFMAYSPTSANGRLKDSEGNRDIYHSYIAYRPNLEPFHPFDTVDVANEQGLRVVVDDSSHQYSLVWPVPMLSWEERTGDATQAVTPSIVDPESPIAAGMPHAQIGTSALYNTDRKPFDCWLGGSGQTPYSPNKAHTNVNQENDLIVHNTDGLTVVQNQNDFCEPLSPANVLGIAVQLTSNKTNMSAGFAPGYTTDGNGKKEAAKLIGVYDVRNQADQSFLATIPAHAPIELHLLDRRYGLRLADVRSWHSLQPRETRNDCGGCHQHEPGMAIPFAGTVADSQPALDMVNRTPFLTYDADCNPVLRQTRRPTRTIPEWNSKIWPGFDQYCGDCHNSNRSTDAEALAALDYDEEAEAYNKLKGRNYADSTLGALGSPAFWAARGERTDGRNNNLAKYAPDYAAGAWGYRFSAVHATDPGLCNQGDAVRARWVYRFGRWIDNHMPRDTGASYGYQHDWYHPTVDGAISSPGCSPTELRIGYWDDAGGVAELQVLVNDAEIATYTNRRNGSVVVPLPRVGSNDSVRVVARDPSDNRQMYEKSIAQLVSECVPEGPTPQPKPIRVRRLGARVR
jgi:hypothetical protein